MGLTRFVFSLSMCVVLCVQVVLQKCKQSIRMSSLNVFYLFSVVVLSVYVVFELYVVIESLFHFPWFLVMVAQAHHQKSKQVRFRLVFLL